MKTKKIIIPLLITVLLFNLSSCNKGPYEDCTVNFRIDFINKNTGECYKEIDSLLSIYNTDTIYLYSKPHLGGTINDMLFENEVGDNCLSMFNSGIDFDKKVNPTIIYVIGKAPNFIDTIEFKYNGSTAEIRVNGVLQDQKAMCNEQAVLEIIK